MHTIQGKIMKYAIPKCENNGCGNVIEVPSIDCPGQCYSCSIKSRERVAAGMAAIKSRADKFAELSGTLTNAEFLAKWN